MSIVVRPCASGRPLCRQRVDGRSHSRVVTEPFGIPVGRVAVVADPFDNILVLLDLSEGHYVTDKMGNVTAVAR